MHKAAKAPTAINAATHGRTIAIIAPFDKPLLLDLTGFELTGEGSVEFEVEVGVVIVA